MQADYLRGMPVLVSFASVKPWMDDLIPSYDQLLIDSGAYSELTGNAKVDLSAYADWAQQWPAADAVAALDDIRGDWERGLENWRRHPWMFPTYHNSDPEEALEVILRERPRWIGLGMVPPRNKREWLLRTLERIPAGIHVHGWALRAYAWHPRLDSVDSTNWFRDALDLNALPLCRHLTPGECVEIVVKRYRREGRMKARAGDSLALPLEGL